MFPNYACGAFYKKWLRDWCDVQQPDGNLPFTAPTYRGGGGPAWSGFLVHLCADMQERFDDEQVVRDCFPHIRRWLDFLEQHTVDDQLQRYDGPAPYIESEWSFLGDWVYSGHEQSPNQDGSMTSFFNNCYYVWTLRRAVRLAEYIDERDTASEWESRANRVAAATHRQYWDSNTSRYTVDRQANLALAMVAQITPKQHERELEQQFIESITATDNHIDTGIGGTPFLFRALDEYGRTDLAFKIASQRDYPSWGKMLDEGATTLWEQWDGEHSRCHSSFLGIAGWYVESVAGIQHDSWMPGYSRILFRPSLIEGLDWAEAELLSPRGKIACAWRRDRKEFSLEIEIPPNSTGLLQLPASNGEVEVRNAATMELLQPVQNANGQRKPAIELGSGHHQLRVRPHAL